MILEEICSRRSIRKYKEKEVDDALIKELIEAARLAPSGSNMQPWHFMIIRNEEMKRKIAEVDHNQKWMLKAPVFIACIADIKCRVKDTEGLYLDENSDDRILKLIIRDTAIAIQNLLLQAEHLGLGACWTGWYEQEDMKKVLNVPDDTYVCGIVTVGYADEAPKARPRREIDTMIHYENW